MADVLQRKVKVLHVITRLDPGGSTINTLQTVARLDRAVYDVGLVAGLSVDPAGEAQEFLRRHAIPCVFVGELVREVSFFKDVAAFVRLCRIMRQEKYDIVHTHSSKAGIIGRWAAWVCGVKKIVHTPHGHVFYGYFPPLLTWFFLMLERISAKITTVLIALTEKGVEEHLALRVGRREQWVAIPSGIDRAVFRPSGDERRVCRQEFGFQEGTVVFMAVARLEAIKNAQILIDALSLLIREYPQARLVFVGDGPQAGFLRDRAARCAAAKNIIFSGYRKDVAAVLNAGDVFVMASVNEGMGRSVLEAMATGLPVIVSRVGGLPSIVRDGEDGFLLDPKDTLAWVEAMRHMLGSQELRQRMAASAMARVGAQFTVEAMVHRIQEVYRA